MFLNNDQDIIKLKLFEAVDDNELDEMKRILESVKQSSMKKAVLSQKNQLGRNILHFACFKGNYLVAEYLLDVMKGLGISIDQRDNRGYTAANLAMIKGYTDTSLYDQLAGGEDAQNIFFEE